MNIKIENLTYIYMQNTPFERCALRGINLEIKSGDLIGIIGHTGCGKSTLIQHLNGLLKPSEGRILIDNESIWDDKINKQSLRFDVGLVFQYPEYQLFEETVYEDIAYGPKNMGLSEHEIKKRVMEATRLVGIEEHTLHKSPFELSGGQKRRVAIAGILAMKPKVLVLDEPAAGLDPAGRKEIMENIKIMHREFDMTVIIVSHSMEEIAKTVKRVVVMNKGEIEADGSVEEIFSKGRMLEEIGLDVPEITRLMRKLKEKGYDVSEKTYTVTAAKEEILKLFKNS